MNIIRLFLIVALAVVSSASPLNSNRFARNQIKKESSEENEIQGREEAYNNNLDRDEKIVMAARFDELNLVDTEESKFQSLIDNKQKEQKAQPTRRTTRRITTTRRPTTTKKPTTTKRTTKKTITTKNPITFTRTTTATTTTQS